MNSVAKTAAQTAKVAAFDDSLDGEGSQYMAMEKLPNRPVKLKFSQQKSPKVSSQSLKVRPRLPRSPSTTNDKQKPAETVAIQTVLPPESSVEAVLIENVMPPAADKDSNSADKLTQPEPVVSTANESLPLLDDPKLKAIFADTELSSSADIFQGWS